MTQPLQLDDADRTRLSGEHGTGPALARRILTSVATSMGAPRLIDIASAHMDGCFYVGEVSLDFARRLADAGARVAVRRRRTSAVLTDCIRNGGAAVRVSPNKRPR